MFPRSLPSILSNTLCVMRVQCRADRTRADCSAATYKLSTRRGITCLFGPLSLPAWRTQRRRLLTHLEILAYQLSWMERQPPVSSELSQGKPLVNTVINQVPSNIDLPY